MDNAPWNMIRYPAASHSPATGYRNGPTHNVVWRGAVVVVCSRGPSGASSQEVMPAFRLTWLTSSRCIVHLRYSVTACPMAPLAGEHVRTWIPTGATVEWKERGRI